MSLGRILLFGVLALLPSMAQATDWRAWTDHLSPYVVGSYGLLPVHARYLEYDSGGGSGNGIPQDMRMTMVDKKGMIGLAGLRVGGDVPLREGSICNRCGSYCGSGATHAVFFRLRWFSGLFNTAHGGHMVSTRHGSTGIRSECDRTPCMALYGWPKPAVPPPRG